MSNVKFNGYPLIIFLLNEMFNVLKMRVNTVKKGRGLFWPLLISTNYY